MSGILSSDCGPSPGTPKHGQQQHKRVSQLSDLSYTSSLPGYAQANSSPASSLNPPKYCTSCCIDAPVTPPASHYSPSESASSVCQTGGALRRSRQESLIESSKAKRRRSAILRQARHRKQSLASHDEDARDFVQEEEVVEDGEGGLLFGTELDLLIGQTSSILLAGNECLSGVIDAREQLRKFQALDSALDRGVVKQEQDLRDRLDSANALQDSMESLVKSVDDFFGDAHASTSTSVPYTKPITLQSRVSSATSSPSHSLLKPPQASIPDVFSDSSDMASLPVAGPSRLSSLAEEEAQDPRMPQSQNDSQAASSLHDDSVEDLPSASTSLAKGIYSSIFGSSSRQARDRNNTDPLACTKGPPQAKDLLSKFANAPPSPSISVTATPPVSSNALPPLSSSDSPSNNSAPSSSHPFSSPLLSTPNKSIHKSSASASVLTTPSTATSSDGPYTPDRLPVSHFDSPASLLSANSSAKKSQQRPSLRPSHHRASSNLSVSSEAVPKADLLHAKGTIRHASNPLPATPQDDEEEAREDDWQVVAKDDSAQGRLRELLFANK